MVFLPACSDHNSTQMSTTNTTNGSTERSQFAVAEGNAVGYGAILLQIGKEGKIDDTEEQLREAHRRAVEHGIIDGGDAQ